VVVGLAACGFAPNVMVTRPDAAVPFLDGGVDAGSVADGGLPLSAACSALNEARCRYFERCGLIPADAVVRAACVAQQQATWCGPSTWVSRATATPPTLRYEPSRGEACTRAFETRACSEWATEPESCTRMVVPATLLRQACFGGWPECTEGVCRGAVCPRSCQPLGESGDACSVSDDCRLPLFCRTTTSSPGVGVCSPVATLGMPCSATAECSDGLLCELGRCVAKPTTGQSCRSGVCDDNALCVPRRDGGVCEPRFDAGVGCRQSAECLPGLICSSGRCVTALVSPTADMCLAGQKCPTGLVCIFDSPSDIEGACERPRAQGSRCVVGADCEAHLACLEMADGGGRQCAQRITHDGGCQTDRDCHIYAVCDTGRCAPRGQRGERCSEKRPCLLDACTDGGICGPLAAPGSRCAINGECASGLCTAGVCVAQCSP
jgi:hypothetical protein